MSQSSLIFAGILSALAAINAGFAVYFVLKKYTPLLASFNTGISIFCALSAILSAINSSILK